MDRLFAYGTLMDLNIQKHVLGRTFKMSTATLSGYQLKKGQWPYLVTSVTGVVSGVILSNLSDEDFIKLDAYERVTSVAEPQENQRTIYQREKVEVHREDGSLVWCWVYLPILEKWKPVWLSSPDGIK
jgi:gamma-glutamylcyclotransferase (GGCT)/AIG2-like uncharacterized protein YtfP